MMCQVGTLLKVLTLKVDLDVRLCRYVTKVDCYLRQGK